MKLGIGGLAAAQARLQVARATTAMHTALATQAEMLAEAVRAGLDQPPGGSHDRPWRRTGALHDSVGATVDGLQAAIGSSDPAAAPQELGTRHLPPRPFLAPAAAATGAGLATAIGEAVADALRGEESKAG